MHLKSITIKGFKSFPDRTRLRFAPGVSVVVGPNGCGKSNITDAVLWALGEQSPLAVRGQTMQDVIFAGGQGQRSRSSAEVEVVIDNGDGEGVGVTEFSELSIMRRFDRGGEGEYRINGARCRLADVVETLADANLGREMHSVIGQGKVEEIVHSRPRDRRLLIEEAAGLGKHRKRRRRAQLKLDRTRENLDRALDVEREARSRLRPLKRQAQAAEIHTRLEREANEARGRLLSSELANHAELLAAAEREGAEARAARDEQEALLADAAKRREAIEERLANRDRERTEEWGRLTMLRAAHERLGARGEALSSRAAQLRDRVERGRQALGELALEVKAASTDDPLAEQIGMAKAGIEAAAAALAELGRAEGAARGTVLGRVRSGAERAARAARAGEELLGRESQDSLADRVEDGAALLAEIEALGDAIAAARDAAGVRADDHERRVIGASDGGDGLADELRACSRAEADLRAELHTRNERFTETEVRLTQLRDRRSEREAELAKIVARLDESAELDGTALDDAGREELERKLERLARRREQLGPVNPLAESEYEEAKRRVTELEEQRTDSEQALAELETLIRETDRTIAASFEETFEATRRNFEELVGELFPGGKGRLSLVEPPRARAPIGGAPGEHGPEDTAADAETDEEEELSEEERKDERGVEIEVTPRGKATRRLTLLSGGEKTLVAIAFVFSVFLARPSPFYILDEVEAALDDVNIDRFIKLVRRFSDRAQFVIVTHQKRTMDAADALYGVSMSDGITKVVSRKMPQLRQAGLDEPGEGEADRVAEAA